MTIAGGKANLLSRLRVAVPHRHANGAQVGHDPLFLAIPRLEQAKLAALKVWRPSPAKLIP